MRYLKVYFLALTVITLASCTSNDDTTKLGNWIRKADYGGNARRDAVSFVIGDTAYVGTGTGTGSDNLVHRLNDFWKYDPVKDAWTSMAPLGGDTENDADNIYSRYGASAFTVGSKGYVTTGSNNVEFVAMKDTWEFDPATNTWEQKADFPGNARFYAVGFALGDFGYVGTGTTGSTNFNDFYKFTPGAAHTPGTWTEVSPLKDKRTQAAAFVIKDSAYVVSGVSNSLANPRMYVYDAIHDNWIERWQITNATDGSFDDDYTTIERSGAVAFVLNNKGYLATGTNNTWEYDPISGYWTEKTTFDGTSRSGAVGFTVKSKGFVVTGGTGTTTGLLDDMRQFDPSAENSTNDN